MHRKTAPGFVLLATPGPPRFPSRQVIGIDPGGGEGGNLRLKEERARPNPSQPEQQVLELRLGAYPPRSWGLACQSQEGPSIRRWNYLQASVQCTFHSSESNPGLES